MALCDHLWATLITYVDRDRFWRWRLSGELAWSYLALARPPITGLLLPSTGPLHYSEWSSQITLLNLCLPLCRQQQRCANKYSPHDWEHVMTKPTFTDWNVWNVLKRKTYYFYPFSQSLNQSPITVEVNQIGWLAIINLTLCFKLICRQFNGNGEWNEVR